MVGELIGSILLIGWMEGSKCGGELIGSILLTGWMEGSKCGGRTDR